MGLTLWTCSDCGDSGMSYWNDICSCCGHALCLDCIRYDPGHPKGHLDICKPSQINTASTISMNHTLLPGNKLVDTGVMYNSRSNIPKQLDWPPEKSAPIQGNCSPLSTPTPDLIMCSEAGLSSSYSTPFSQAIQTPQSTQESAVSSEVSSPRESTDSQSDFATEDSESTDEMTDDEYSPEASDIAFDILESRLLIVLGPDIQLVSRLITEIFDQLQFPPRKKGVAFTVSPSDGSNEVPENHGGWSMSTLTPGSGISSNSSLRDKRGRERDESTDRRKSPGLKKRRKLRERSAEPRPRFACHFHKKDPAHYCPLVDPIFKWCVGRGDPELRRLKGHYSAHHRPAQCDRCYSIFKNRDELKNHRQAVSECQRSDVMLKEGIDDGQWEKIEPLFGVGRQKSKLSPEDRRQQDIEKWFQIWDILFPDIIRPADPWVHLPTVSSNPSSVDVETILTNVNNLMEIHYENGLLSRDIHQHVEVAVRLALQLSFENQTANFEPIISFHQHFADVQEPEPTEQQSIPHVEANPVETMPQQHIQGTFGAGLAEVLETSSSSSVNPSIHESANILQPFHGNIPLLPNTPSSILRSNPVTDLPGGSIHLQHSAPPSPSSTLHQNVPLLQQPDEYVPHVDTAQNEDYFDLFEGTELLDALFFAPSHDPFQSIEPSDSQFGEEPEQLDSDTLFRTLEEESERPDAMSDWKDGRDRNRGLQGL